LTGAPETDSRRQDSSVREATASPVDGDPAQRREGGSGGGEGGGGGGGGESRGQPGGTVEEDTGAESGPQRRPKSEKGGGAGRGHKKGEIRNLVGDLSSDLKRDLENSYGASAGAASGRGGTDAERDEEVRLGWVTACLLSYGWRTAIGVFVGFDIDHFVSICRDRKRRSCDERCGQTCGPGLALREQIAAPLRRLSLVKRTHVARDLLTGLPLVVDAAAAAARAVRAEATAHRQRRIRAERRWAFRIVGGRARRAEARGQTQPILPARMCARGTLTGFMWAPSSRCDIEICQGLFGTSTSGGS
jgi:hypothetical protein